jgi:small subunit ribosomal protein S13
VARIAGVDLPKNERIEIGLTRIFGIGRSLSQRILAETKVNPNTRAKDLTDEEIVKIRSVIDRDYKVEGDLRRDISMGIKRLMDIGCYRGMRHRLGLPVRGQRTRTNARTRKGPRKAAVGRKKEA